MDHCNNSCAAIMHCETPEECPVKQHSEGKNCWEVSFMHNNWEKVFEKCSETVNAKLEHGIYHLTIPFDPQQSCSISD